MRTILLLLFLFFTFSLNAQTELNFKRLGAAEGLLNRQVRCLEEDKQGFLWIGTRDGLYRYDGYSMDRYRKSDGRGMKASVINDLLTTNSGSLFVCANQGTFLFNNTTQTFDSVPFISSDGHVEGNRFSRVIAQGTDGRVFVAGSRFIFRFQSSDTTFRRIDYAESNKIALNDIQDIEVDRSGTLWVLSKKQGLFSLNTENGVLSSSILPNQGTLYSKLYIDTEGIKWLGTSKGLFKLTNDSLAKHFTKASHLLAGDNIRGLIAGQQNKLLVATSSGLSHFDTRTEESENYFANEFDQLSLSSSGMSSVLIDSNGILWVGTSNNGLNCTQTMQNPFSLLRHIPDNESSIISNTVISVFEDSKQQVWIGTRGEGLTIWNKKDNTYKHLNEKNSPLQSNTIRDFYEDNEGIIWIATYQGGISYFNPETEEIKTLTKQKGKNSLSSNITASVIQSKDGRMCFATRGIDVYDKESGSYKSIKASEDPTKGLTSNFIIKLFEDSEGLIWSGAYFGLTCYNPITQTSEKFTSTDKTTSLVGNWVYAICESKTTGMWFGTNSGLSHYDKETKQFNSFGLNDGLPSEIINGIVEDNNGNLWLSTGKGIVRFSPETGEMISYFGRDNVQREYFHASYWKGHDGTIYFGGYDGVTYFHPDSVQPSGNKTTVHFSDLMLNYESILPNQEGSPLQQHISETDFIELEYSQAEVMDIEFIGLNLYQSEQIQYQFILENFSSDWKQIGNQRKVSFTNLSPGTYTLKVKASNVDGHWNGDEASLTIKINPPIWMTWWFRTASILFVFFLFFSFYRIRIARIKAQKEELERQVKARTAEVMQQKEEIQAQAENLAQKNLLLEESSAEISQKNEELEVLAENLADNNKMLQGKNDEIERQNEFIRGSINYAKTIQQAMLPVSEKIAEHFEHFILFRPRDIVSGDFYWWIAPNKSPKPSSVFFAVVDCTGHGVPGAFVSMVGNRLLNEIVREKRIVEPNEILKELHHGVYSELKQKTSENNDGMDVCLCRIDNYGSDSPTVVFAGAKRPLLYITDNELKRIKGSVKKIGGHQKRWGKSEFEQTSIVLKKGDLIYLTTDGYVDQNNPNRERFGSKAFADLLIKLTNEPLPQQLSLLEKTLDSFQKDAEQRDDITMMGIRL